MEHNKRDHLKASLGTETNNTCNCVTDKTARDKILKAACLERQLRK